MTSGLREAKREATARELASTAYEMVTARGFAAVTVDDIVARAGVSRRTFSNYFTSKEAAVAETLVYAVSAGLDGWTSPAGEQSRIGLARDLVVHLVAAGAPERLVELAALARSHPQLLPYVRDAHWRVWSLAGERITAARVDDRPLGAVEAVEAEGLMGALFGVVSDRIFSAPVNANTMGGEAHSPSLVDATALVADIGALLDRLERGFGAD